MTAHLGTVALHEFKRLAASRWLLTGTLAGAGIAGLTVSFVGSLSHASEARLIQSALTTGGVLALLVSYRTTFVLDRVEGSIEVLVTMPLSLSKLWMGKTTCTTMVALAGLTMAAVSYHVTSSAIVMPWLVLGEGVALVGLSFIMTAFAFYAREPRASAAAVMLLWVATRWAFDRLGLTSPGKEALVGLVFVTAAIVIVGNTLPEKVVRRPV